MNLVVIMTGATSGIGLAAATQLRVVPGVRLLVGKRASTTDTDFLPLDLESLNSVRCFADAVKDALPEAATIAALVLNAGVQFGSANHRTRDGFETTFAVNHLAHYLLLRLLMPRLAFGARVVITTSNLHDARTNHIAPPEHADAQKLACGRPELSKSQDRRSGIRAYAASKLCNVLTARALASSALAQDRNLRVIAFNPGFIPGTKLTRHQPLSFRLPFSIVAPIMSRLNKGNTLLDAGSHLASLVLGNTVPPKGRIYASLVKGHITWPDPSLLANDDAVMKELWCKSAGMVSLPDHNQ